MIKNNQGELKGGIIGVNTKTIIILWYKISFNFERVNDSCLFKKHLSKVSFLLNNEYTNYNKS